MAECYVGEIRMFGGNFAPVNWAFCNGQLLSISEYEVLFQLIGTTYGGDGQETFALPDLRGRLPLHQGTGPGLTTRVIGEASGTETVTLITTNIPAHNHLNMATTQTADLTNPSGQLAGKSIVDIYTTDLSTPVAMNPRAITPSGGSQPHANMMPYLAVSFIISLYGVFPSQG